jgi:hypothetical protein
MGGHIDGKLKWRGGSWKEKNNSPTVKTWWYSTLALWISLADLFPEKPTAWPRTLRFSSWVSLDELIVFFIF